MKKCINCFERVIRAKNLCKRCYYYLRRTGNQRSNSLPNLLKKQKGQGCLRKDGYRSLMINKKRILEHTHIMEIHLGRKLFKNENIHHKNGVRYDNRIENLELWTTSHSSGQRVEDKVKWIKEFIKNYPEFL